MRCRFPYVGADLRKFVLQPGTSEHSKTTDTGKCITRGACLVPSFRRVLIPGYPQTAGSG